MQASVFNLGGRRLAAPVDRGPADLSIRPCRDAVSDIALVFDRSPSIPHERALDNWVAIIVAARALLVGKMNVPAAAADALDAVRFGPRIWIARERLTLKAG